MISGPNFMKFDDFWTKFDEIFNFINEKLIKQPKYLQKHQKDLSRYNININNLIRAWETNNWPWNNKQKDDPNRIGF